MKSTVKVSISSIAFNLEDDAYLLIKNYLDKLTLHFSKNEEGKEIIEDIEARLAELLLARISTPEQVITAKEANEVIEVLGKPEDLNDDDHSNAKSSSIPYSPSITTKKRLYRDPDNQVIAGVCGGLGVYFNIDPVIFRILFAALMLSSPFFWPLNFGAIAFVTYIVLWISLPKALTMAQKLEMQGESPSVANIERKMREEALKSSTSIQQPRRNILGRLFRISFYVFAAIIAIPVICVGIALIIAFIAVVFAGGWVLHDSVFPLMDFVSIAGTNLTIVKILALIIIIVPLLLLVYAAIRLLFRFKAKSRSIVLSLAIIWGLSLFGLIGISGYTLKDYRYGSKITVKEAIVTNSDTLYIKLPEHFAQDNSRFYWGWSSDDRHPHIPFLWIDEQENMMSIFPNIDVYYVSDSTFNITYTRSARAKSKGLARKKVEEVPMQFNITDSLVTIAPHEFTKGKKWSGEFGKLTIYAPKDKKVIIDDELNEDSSHSYHWDHDIFD